MAKSADPVIDALLAALDRAYDKKSWHGTNLKGSIRGLSVEAGLKAWEAAHPRPVATVSTVADHVEHVAKVAGYDHVGLGGDFDGIDSTPEGLNGVEDYPNLFAELIRRGWSDENLAKLAGGNVLRALRQAEAVSASMKNEPAALSPLDEAPSS